jgi:TolB-like protein/Tfp pilus assembly protein PilF
VLFRLRNTIGDGLLLSRGREQIGVAIDRLWCDARALETLLADGRPDEALALYRGELLEGFHIDVAGFEPWLDLERARLRRRATDAAVAVADRQERAGDLAGASASLQRALELQPTHEHLARRGMLLRARMGDAAGALADYELLRHRLRDEYDLEPADETVAVAQAIRAREVRAETAWSSPEHMPIKSIAVLPFRDSSGDTDTTYFADGMTDALIAALSRIGSLRVISRQSALAYRDRSAPLRRIASELGVDAVLDGAVLRVADRVRITAYLIRVAPEEHIWSGIYDRQLHDILTLHSDLSDTIAQRVETAATSPDALKRPKPRAVDPAAYEAYLKGRYFTGIWPDIARAIEHFQHATTIDPTFAPAFAGLALCYWNLAIYALLPPTSIMPPFASAVRTALELDPDSSDARLALAGYKALGPQRDVAGAQEQLHHAIRLDPNSAHAHAYCGGHLIATGRADEGLPLCRQAASLDPLNPWVLHVLGWAYYRIGELDQALDVYRQILELYPHFGLGYPFLGQIWCRLSRFAEAVDACREARARQPADALVLGYGVAILARAGNARESDEWLAALTALAEQQYVDAYYVAVAYAGRDDCERALEQLQQVRDGDSTSYWLARTEPFFDVLRGDRRYSEMLSGW